MKAQAVTASQRQQVMDRDRGCCLRCGCPVVGRAHSIHHRRNRGMGGTRHAAPLSELVLLCGTGTTGCHGEITQNPGEAYATGWLIRRSDPDTADMIGVLTLTGQRLFLHDDGTVTTV